VVPHSRPWITHEDQRAVSAQLDSALVGEGAAVRRFEAALGAKLPGIAVASGTSAVHLALLALGAGPGDEVILPTYVCRSVGQAVYATGASVRLCDVGADWTVDRAAVAAVMSRRSRAVIVPHMYGLFADVAAIAALGLPVIEDRAQAIGHPLPPLLDGTLAVYSFHATKCITTGEGGMVVASTAQAAQRLRELRDGPCDSLQGRGVFVPMSDLAAALGLSQLERYGEAVQRRTAMAAAYERAVCARRADAHTTYRAGAAECFRFVLRATGGVDAAQSCFANRGVIVRRGVDQLLHRLVGADDASFPNAVQAYATSVSIPCHASMTVTEHTQCAQALEKWLAMADLLPEPASVSRGAGTLSDVRAKERR
jgi:dTDP-4-amino-4,6-dideoxygalactose transaminase